MLTSSAHDEKLASRGKNYQTRQIFVSRPREAKFSPKFCRTRAETAEQTDSRGKELSCLPQVCAGLYGILSFKLKNPNILVSKKILHLLNVLAQQELWENGFK